MLYLDYCAHFAVYFLAFLLFPVLLICFLHRSFISGNSWFISPNRYFIVSVFHIDFPEFFSFPYPRASFKVLNFSAYFPEFRRLLYFLVYFDRFVFICLFLWILICFSESEPLVFSSLAKTHQVVKLKRRPQWWQNAFVGYVNWREALKHIHYLLAIIESSIFVRSLVASLVVSHHWRRRCHLITYCSFASCCKEVRSPCFLFTLHGHIVKLVTASNFTRILTNENVSPDSRITHHLHWAKGALTKHEYLMLTSNTYGGGILSLLPVFGEWQPWGPRVVRWQSLKLCIWLCRGACYGASAAVASGGAGCSLYGNLIIVVQFCARKIGREHSICCGRNLCIVTIFYWSLDLSFLTSRDVID